uniref:Uncharacterized protein n=1 Tax=Pararge aegeria TaxID=116150 RepID=S4PRX2_9NEOP
MCKCYVKSLQLVTFVTLFQLPFSLLSDMAAIYNLIHLVSSYQFISLTLCGAQIKSIMKYDNLNIPYMVL